MIVLQNSGSNAGDLYNLAEMSEVMGVSAVDGDDGKAEERQTSHEAPRATVRRGASSKRRSRARTRPKTTKNSAN